MYQIDLNCDLGESFGNYKLGMDDEVISYISSANIACGFHASDPLTMSHTVELAKKVGVCVGAHPGFPDLVGFGRRNMNVSPNEAKAMVQYQIGALNSFCSAHKVKMCHVKPHGALYNMAGKDFKLALAICEGIYEVNPELILLALSGSEMITAAKSIGLKVAREAFADRAYEEDGSLVSRTKQGSMITDEKESIKRVIRIIKENKIESITGKDISIEVDSICIHGDGIRTLEFIQKISSSLKEENIKIVPLYKMVLK